MNKLILLSGGMDSALCLHRYGAALALGLDYGQPHLIELAYAQRLAAFYGVPFVRLQIPEMPRVDDVVFAGRNAVLLSMGAAVAQERGLDAIVIGCNLSDATRFADCRPAFIRSMDEALFAAYGAHVVAPLLGLTKQADTGRSRGRAASADLDLLPAPGRRSVWRVLCLQGVAVNTYTTEFFALCPKNDIRIRYRLRIETGLVIEVEDLIGTVQEDFLTGFHEDMADRLLTLFGGRQTLTAEHHGVVIETTRP